MLSQLGAGALVINSPANLFSRLDPARYFSIPGISCVPVFPLHTRAPVRAGIRVHVSRGRETRYRADLVNASGYANPFERINASFDAGGGGW